ncbi:ppdK [Symbiodinium necroappetens]|uniref:PpdK protein n=1 Tax=Symbiodinium necroappetens TaxID=1628268 RepID=A0A812RSR2_9DINO|nr:ppdK [Symbiodinium necroappetens]
MAMKMRHRLHNVEFKRPTSVPESLAVAAVESEPQPARAPKTPGSTLLPISAAQAYDQECLLGDPKFLVKGYRDPRRRHLLVTQPVDALARTYSVMYIVGTDNFAGLKTIFNHPLSILLLACPLGVLPACLARRSKRFVGSQPAPIIPDLAAQCIPMSIMWCCCCFCCCCGCRLLLGPAGCFGTSNMR